MFVCKTICQPVCTFDLNDKSHMYLMVNQWIDVFVLKHHLTSRVKWNLCIFSCLIRPICSLLTLTLFSELIWICFLFLKAPLLFSQNISMCVLLLWRSICSKLWTRKKEAFFSWSRGSVWSSNSVSLSQKKYTTLMLIKHWISGFEVKGYGGPPLPWTTLLWQSGSSPNYIACHWEHLQGWACQRKTRSPLSIVDMVKKHPPVSIINSFSERTGSEERAKSETPGQPKDTRWLWTAIDANSFATMA